MEDIFGPLIDAHTREDAIAAEQLIPVARQDARAAGIWWETAFTAAAWARIGTDALPSVLAAISAVPKRPKGRVDTSAGVFEMTWEPHPEHSMCLTVGLPGED